MDSDVERLKLETSHDVRVAVVKEEPNSFDKIPDEIFEIIISYVLYKKSCFQVDKRFNEESIKATSNRCRLVLNLDETDSWIQESDPIFKITRKFDKICLKFKSSCATDSYVFEKLMNILAHYEPQVKVLTVHSKMINNGFVKETLSRLPNLESLEINFDSEHSRGLKTGIQLLRLKRLNIHIGMLNMFTCPALEELVLSGWLRDSDATVQIECFTQRHTHLKQLDLPHYIGSNCSGQLTSILSITGLSLDKLDNSRSIRSPSRVTRRFHYLYNDRYSMFEEISTFCSVLSKQTDLQTLKLPMMSLDCNQLLRCISNLQRLETLSISLQESNEPISEMLVSNILLLKHLKVLTIKTNKLELLEPLTTVENLRLEELTLDVPSNPNLIMQRRILQAFAENLPSLKKISLFGIDIRAALIMASCSRNLDYLELCCTSWNHKAINFPAPNFNIRKLKLMPRSVPSTNIIEACAKVMPNVRNLSYYQGFVAMQNNICSLLKFDGLKKFKAGVQFLLQPETIYAINNQGQQIIEIIVRLDGHKTKSLVLNYGREFPIHVLSNEKDLFVMIRDDLKD